MTFVRHPAGLNKENKVSYRLPDYWVQAFIDGEGMFYSYISALLEGFPLQKESPGC